ncbi:helix-turn-helix domain-containing protein [Pedobacter nutrimenti]|nr:helix-turn-helix domain-containing protein [Pedobacter nutrimenti]
MKTVSNNIRQLRQKKGWKQRDVAALLKISIPVKSS